MRCTARWKQLSEGLQHALAQQAALVIVAELEGLQTTSRFAPPLPMLAACQARPCSVTTRC
eukprot:15447225-Alexandrium_andersonii.AAC.2